MNKDAYIIPCSLLDTKIESIEGLLINGLGSNQLNKELEFLKELKNSSLGVKVTINTNNIIDLLKVYCIENGVSFNDIISKSRRSLIVDHRRNFTKIAKIKGYNQTHIAFCLKRDPSTISTLIKNEPIKFNQ